MMVETMGRASTRRPGNVASAFLVLLIGLALFAAWGWLRDRQLRDLASLPPAERAGLYERTMKNLATVCAEGSAVRRDTFCQEQAELALRFPECDAACQGLARPLVASPTR